jgi:hypothetical protein
VRNLYGYQAAVRFDPQILEVVDADDGQPGDQLALGDLIAPDFVLQNSADNDVGAVLVVVTQLAPSTPASGRGDVFTIAFRALAPGTSSVKFTDLRLADTETNLIPAETQDAQIVVK